MDEKENNEGERKSAILIKGESWMKDGRKEGRSERKQEEHEEKGEEKKRFICMKNLPKMKRKGYYKKNRGD